MVDRRRTTSRWGALLYVVVAATGCGSPEQEEADTGMEEVPTERPEAMPMADDHRLEEHMQRMAAVPPDSLVHVMPMHLEEVGAMLDEMEPMSLGMQSDTVWRSTLDSVQNDLARMRDMGDAELRELMPEHSRRVERLIFLHDSAMGSER